MAGPSDCPYFAGCTGHWLIIPPSRGPVRCLGCQLDAGTSTETFVLLARLSIGCHHACCVLGLGGGEMAGLLIPGWHCQLARNCHLDSKSRSLLAASCCCCAIHCFAAPQHTNFVAPHGSSNASWCRWTNSLLWFLMYYNESHLTFSSATHQWIGASTVSCVPSTSNVTQIGLDWHFK